jgi:hypothetical protein
MVKTPTVIAVKIALAARCPRARVVAVAIRVRDGAVGEAADWLARGVVEDLIWPTNALAVREVGHIAFVAREAAGEAGDPTADGWRVVDTKAGGAWLCHTL